MSAKVNSCERQVATQMILAPPRMLFATSILIEEATSVFRSDIGMRRSEKDERMSR